MSWAPIAGRTSDSAAGPVRVAQQQARSAGLLSSTGRFPCCLPGGLVDREHQAGARGPAADQLESGGRAGIGEEPAPAAFETRGA